MEDSDISDTESIKWYIRSQCRWLFSRVWWFDLNRKMFPNLHNVASLCLGWVQCLNGNYIFFFKCVLNWIRYFKKLKPTLYKYVIIQMGWHEYYISNETVNNLEQNMIGHFFLSL